MGVLGLVLIVLGVLFLLVGLVGAAKALWSKPANEGVEGLPSWLDAFFAILKQGGWTAAVATGTLLLVIGLALTGSDVVSDDDEDEDTPAALIHRS